ncbi:sterol 24-C-methyltransferase, partial [Thalassiosira pseudonana CCMP1335]
SNVQSSVSEYERLHLTSTSTTERNSNYATLVNSYYDLATLFYEWGWGASFHFSNRHPHESFDEATRRHEFYLAMKEGSTPSMASVKVLDVGCGIGGPMRNICKFTGADITGLTLNQYQVDRGNELCRADAHFHNHSSETNGLPPIRCRSTQGDFMKQPFEASTFDAAYAIEATCHAPDRVGCYSEIYRVLKPGSIFACYEWCLTDKYDPNNEEHVLIKKQIEEGDGLPDIATTHYCLTALKKAGFEILEERDCVNDEMLPLMSSWNPFTQRFQFNWFGLRLTKYSLKIMEFLRLAPVGTSRTQILLQSGGMGLARGGELGIFTPMYLMVGRVPLDKK